MDKVSVQIAPHHLLWLAVRGMGDDGTSVAVKYWAVKECIANGYEKDLEEMREAYKQELLSRLKSISSLSGDPADSKATAPPPTTAC